MPSWETIISITYNITTNFGAKDELPANDPDKIVFGSEFTQEFTAIKSAFTLAAPTASPVFTGTATFANATVNGTLTADLTGDVTGTLLTAAQPNITSVGTLTSASISGDLAVDTDTLFVDASENKVGIGVTSPTAKLHVAGTIQSQSGSSVAQMYSDGSAAYFTSVGAFPSIFSTNGTERLRIDASGNVGIGTASPQGSLHVANNDTFNVPFRIENIGGSNSFDIRVGTGTTILETNGAQELGFSTNNTERMRIDTAGNVGIGTSSPSSTLEVKSSGTGAETVASFGNQTIPNGLQIQTNGNLEWGFNALNSRSLTFSTNQTERARIDSNGRVGINQNNPDCLLEVTPPSTANLKTATFTAGNSDVNFRLGFGNGSGSAVNSEQGVLGFYYDNNLVSSIGFHRGNAANAGPITFNINGTERARIDTSGNLLVGTTNTDPAANDTNGTAVLTFGGASMSRTNSAALFLNRSSSDGSILNIRKDGTTVGSIGAFGGDLTLGTGITGIHFKDASDAIIPYNVSTGADRNGDIDLGLASSRFKDLYLSGGVYLGGTGAANYLDDYEEGTWTPAVTTGTINYNYATYVKVGNLVTLSAYINTFSDRSTASFIEVTGLPFLSASGDFGVGATLARYVNLGTGGDPVAYTAVGSTRINFYVMTKGGNYEAVKHSHLNNTDAVFYFTISYRTA